MSENPGLRVLAKDRPPVPTAGWRSASARHVSAKDQDTVNDLERLAQVAPALARSAPALLSMMRDHMAGQPQAAHYGTGDGERDPADDPLLSLWCSLHDRTVSECVEAGAESCYDFGEVHAARPDPTGNAALGIDRAEQDRAAFVHHVRLAQRELAAAWSIASAYPTGPLPPADADESPGEDLCRSCWKHNRYPKLIERKADGTPYYKGLCRWCGVTRAALTKGLGFAKDDPTGDPPTELVAAHIDGTLTQGKVDKAQRQLVEIAERRNAEARAKAKAAAARKKRKRK